MLSEGHLCSFPPGPQKGCSSPHSCFDTLGGSRTKRSVCSGGHSLELGCCPPPRGITVRERQGNLVCWAAAGTGLGAHSLLGDGVVHICAFHLCLF